MVNHNRIRNQSLPTIAVVASVLLAGACGRAPIETESTSITCDGVAISTGVDSVDITPLVTVKPGDELPTAIRLGTSVKDPSVPFARGSINVPLSNNEVRPITVVVVTNKIGSVALCPSVDAYLHSQHAPIDFGKAK